MNTLAQHEMARLDPFKQPPPELNLARVKASQLSIEMGNWAPGAMRASGFKAPYHIADIVETFGCPVWARFWSEGARQAFVGALVGTPEVDADTAKRFHTATSSAITADTAVWDAWDAWRAYGDTICTEEDYAAHTARHRASIRAVVAELRRIQ